jgi:hypothetical protein
MAVKWGVAFGCEVYVISRSRAKEADALKMGVKVRRAPARALGAQRMHSCARPHPTHPKLRPCCARQPPAPMAHAPPPPLTRRPQPQAVIPTNDEDAIKAMANKLDGIIDTVRGGEGWQLGPRCCRQ